MSEHAELRGQIGLVLVRRSSVFPQVPRQEAHFPPELRWSDSVLALLGIALAAWLAVLILGTLLFV